MNIRTFETLPLKSLATLRSKPPARFARFRSEKKACFIITKFFVDSNFKNCEHTDGLHLRNCVDVICDFCLNILYLEILGFYVKQQMCPLDT